MLYRQVRRDDLPVIAENALRKSNTALKLPLAILRNYKRIGRNFFISKVKIKGGDTRNKAAMSPPSQRPYLRQCQSQGTWYDGILTSLSGLTMTLQHGRKTRSYTARTLKLIGVIHE